MRKGLAIENRAWMPIIGAAFIALCVLLFALLTSYRVAQFDAVFVWQVASPRVFLAFSAGMAFAVVGATLEHEKHGLQHAVAYGLLMSAVCGVVVASLTAWGWLAGIAVCALLIVLVMILSTRVFRDDRFSTLALALLLALGFALNTINFAGAWLSPAGSSVILRWALGDISLAGEWSLIGFVVACVLTAAIASNLNASWIAPLLLGLGFGLAGPVLFVAWMVPMLLRRLTRLSTKRSLLLCSGLLGGSLVVLLDTSTALLLGGYAPPLSVPIALISIPALLWWNHKRLAKFVPAWYQNLQAIVLLAITALVFVVLVHLVMYAQANT